MHQLNLGSEPYLKDFVRAGVLKFGRLTRINQEKVDEVNDFLQIHPGSNVRSFVEASSIPETTTTYRIITEHLLLKPYKAQFVQRLYEKDRVEMLLSLLTELGNKSNIRFLFR